MELADVRAGQRVRWRAGGLVRSGQVFMVNRRAGTVFVIFFSGWLRDWALRQIPAAELEPVRDAE